MVKDFNKIIERIDYMMYKFRLPFILFVDSCTIILAVVFSHLLVGMTPENDYFEIGITILFIIISYHFLSFLLNLYNKSWEYSSIGELLIILKVVSLSILAAALMHQIFLKEIYMRLLVVSWLLQLFLIGGTRFCGRIFRDSFVHLDVNKKRTLIVGAGSAGTMVVRQLQKSKDTDLLPVAFIDDDRKKYKLDILGVPVVGDVKSIERIVKQYQIEMIVIAIPSLSIRELKQIFNECVKTTAKTQILPMLEDLVTGKVSVNQFREVQVEDLLGREPIELDIKSISDYLTNKTVLVTGAGGSIGSEICRQVAPFYPSKLILVGHGENSIYSIEMELKEHYSSLDLEIIAEIADIQDAEKMNMIMRRYKPDVVYHAAAHKHVPLMERNPEEAFKNNVIGTLNTARAASWNGVKTFVMISTDKAVNPTSVMGSTKRLAEMIVQEMDKTSMTTFVAVRFGNVLGSRGSVIPLFKQQIEKGGPVTVTHPDMVRYFMTIPEASRLVIQTGALAKGGEIFVLDMGDPVKIVDLAKNMIKLSGNSIEEIGIEFTGIRPGEKLYEELLKEGEVHNQQIYPKIYVVKRIDIYIEEIDTLIANFLSLEKEELREKLLMIANNNKLDSTSFLSVLN